MKPSLKSIEEAWVSGDKKTALTMLVKIVNTDPASDKAWQLFRTLAFPDVITSMMKTSPTIRCLVAEKHMVEVNIDVFSFDEEVQFFQIYWQGISHYAFSFDGIQKSVALFCPEAKESVQWWHIPLKRVQTFSERPAERESITLVVECDGGEVCLGTTNDTIQGKQWLAGANELLAFRKKHSQLG